MGIEVVDGRFQNNFEKGFNLLHFTVHLVGSPLLVGTGRVDWSDMEWSEVERSELNFEIGFNLLHFTSLFT